MKKIMIQTKIHFGDEQFGLENSKPVTTFREVKTF